jgi:ligand-binding SRPBCC domain-containing protein
MKLILKTPVQQSYLQVWKGFEETLFRRLSPPFPPVRVVRFDGCLKGNMVELELNFFLFKQLWTSKITEQQGNAEEVFFIDEGVKLPFFLSYWRHRHRIIKDGEHTIIADEIEFRTPFILTDYLFYPLLYGQFLYRKPIYRKVFS